MVFNPFGRTLQEGGTCCGIWACLFARHAAEDLHFNFAQPEIHHIIRPMIAIECFCGRLYHRGLGAVAAPFTLLTPAGQAQIGHTAEQRAGSNSAPFWPPPLHHEDDYVPSSECQLGRAEEDTHASHSQRLQLTLSAFQLACHREQLTVQRCIAAGHITFEALEAQSVCAITLSTWQLALELSNCPADSLDKPHLLLLEWWNRATLAWATSSVPMQQKPPFEQV